jgi:hypothetical protein
MAYPPVLQFKDRRAHIVQFKLPGMTGIPAHTPLLANKIALFDSLVVVQHKRRTGLPTFSAITFGLYMFVEKSPGSVIVQSLFRSSVRISRIRGLLQRHFRAGQISSIDDAGATETALSAICTAGP